MKIGTHKNRYGDLYTFTPTEDGNIFWSGSFTYSRFAWPNDYTKSYAAYVEEGGTMKIEEFKKKVHEWDDLAKEYVMGRKFISLVTSDTSKIDMVDPSGGPYVCTGMELDDRIVVGITCHDGGYLLEMQERQ